MSTFFAKIVSLFSRICSQLLQGVVDMKLLECHSNDDITVSCCYNLSIFVYCIAVHKGTVIRHVVLEDDGLLEAVNPSQQPSENSPERATVILERAIEIPRMFPVLQDLAPNRAQGRVNSVFFSEVRGSEKWISHFEAVGSHCHSLHR